MMGSGGLMSDFVLFAKLDKVISWAQQNAITYLVQDLACCGVEMIQSEGGRYDIERFGAMQTVSPRQADLMIVAGTVTYKSAEALKLLYDQMPGPKYVVAMGSCANCGGMFSWDLSYSTVSGIDKIIPVDVFVPGCPPRPEALLHGLVSLQKRIEEHRLNLNHDSAPRGEAWNLMT